MACAKWLLPVQWPDHGVEGGWDVRADDAVRGLRAYSDRLNDLFTPAGWSRKYAVQTSAPVQRSKQTCGEDFGPL